MKFLSTLSLRRATPGWPPKILPRCYFYPRSPCGERRCAACRPRQCCREFLSTLSLRRATSRRNIPARKADNFYPRSPCGERLDGATSSIPETYFYPRSPCGERPFAVDGVVAVDHISIHALLAESDLSTSGFSASIRTFLSTLSLRRATQVARRRWAIRWIFLSTLSLRRATPCRCFLIWQKTFLSTLSLRRATRGRWGSRRGHHHFYPRSPCGERRGPPGVPAQ